LTYSPSATVRYLFAAGLRRLAAQAADLPRHRGRDGQLRQPQRGRQDVDQRLGPEREARPSGAGHTPLPGWTKSVYGPTGWFEAYSAAGVSHNISVQENTALAFFRLNCTVDCFSR
ncbi:uncharacterized protein P884DRAFT_316650, partial [Thermothelomyces heterothallicus CBS 202.75]|uniref:uncharacterized protein n=1 Tax=Thermothelomyces heterothallicus CBS 202.75 TaxID=1149848 RepID=UPI0037429D1D